jgi:hypothetical protein
VLGAVEAAMMCFSVMPFESTKVFRVPIWRGRISLIHGEKATTCLRNLIRAAKCV